MTKYIARAKARFYISLRVIFPLLPYLRRLKNRNITHNSKRNVSALLWSLLFFEIFESNLLMSTWPTPNIFICHNTNSTRFTNKRTQLKRVIFLIISSNIIFSIYTAILFIFIILLKGKTSRKKSETSKTVLQKNDDWYTSFA